jgi:CelD/BcsL family acetyltransferase involved in cellulose biosynthesis
MKNLTSCAVTDTLSDLERLRPAWSDLLARSASDEPTLTPTWLLTWWQVFGPLDGRQLRIACFYRDGTLIGLAPLLLRRQWYPPAIPFKRLEPLGSGEGERDEICSDYLNVIAARGEEERVAERFAEALASDELGAWDELVLPAMNGESPMPGLLVSSLNRRGISAEAVTTNVSFHIPLPASWPAYLEQLSSSGRYLVKRSLRDFEAWARGEAKLEIVDDRRRLGEGQRVLRALHGERWSAEGRDGVFSSALFSAFHEAVMPALLDQGALELLWLSVRGEPIAALYNIIYRGKTYFYQCGRKMDLPKAVRPGIVMQAEGIRRAIALGRHEYDFLAGTQQYKKQLGLAERPIVEVRAARQSMRERARALAADGIALARSARASLVTLTSQG